MPPQSDPSWRYHYFGAADPAPAQTAEADNGAVAVIRAVDLRPDSDRDRRAVESDFRLDFVYARVIRNVSTRQWAGFIHRLHDNFGLSGFVLDPGGAGLMIRKDLAEPRQLIDNQEVMRMPIVTRDDSTVVEGRFILTMFRPKDPGIERVWKDCTSSDLLNDFAHAGFKQAMDGRHVTWPRPAKEWIREDVHGWGEEMHWCLKNLDAMRRELVKVTVVTDADGRVQFTRNNARQFVARGRKDIAYAGLYCYVAFRVWLEEQDEDYSPDGESASMCSAS